MPEPGQIRFPVARASGGTVPVLTLRRRPVSLDVSEKSVAARETIKAVVSATRAPFGNTSPSTATQAAELERTLRQLELSLAERERAIEEAEARLADRDRELAEAEALLVAREKLLAASRKAAPAATVSPEEKLALEQLRAELERQEASLKEAKQAMRERELFLEENEAKLMEKMQAQQEREIELDQRAEDLGTRAARQAAANPAPDAAT